MTLTAFDVLVALMEARMPVGIGIFDLVGGGIKDGREARRKWKEGVQAVTVERRNKGPGQVAREWNAI